MIAVATPIVVPPPPTGRTAAPRSAVRFARHDVVAMVRAGIVPGDASTEPLNGLLVYVDRGATGKTTDSGTFRFTVGDVDAMVRLGIVPEDASIELLGGVLVHADRAKLGEDPLTVGNDHARCVEQMSDLRTQINTDARHVRSQTPLLCSDGYAPQPDVFVIRGRLRDYASRPTAADAFCVVEVADSSHERDVGEKLFGCARAGVPQYVIVNLRNRTAEVYVNPDPAVGTYGTPTIVPADGALSLRVGADEMLAVPLADVFP